MDYTSLIEDIKAAYESQVSIDEAEKLAAKFLHAQLQIANELHDLDLDSRMKKTGVKNIKSAVRMEELKKHEKKPTEGYLDDIVNLSEIVSTQQSLLDRAEVDRDQLQNYFNIFKEAHIFFRGVSKGRFE